MRAGSPAHDRQLMAWSADLDRLAAAVRQMVPTCEGCRRFERDTINPAAGMGRCQRGHGSWHPMAKHWCKQREARPA